MRNEAQMDRGKNETSSKGEGERQREVLGENLILFFQFAFLLQRGREAKRHFRGNVAGRASARRAWRTQHRIQPTVKPKSRSCMCVFSGAFVLVCELLPSKSKAARASNSRKMKRDSQAEARPEKSE